MDPRFRCATSARRAFTSISNTVSPVKHFLRHTTASAPKSAPFRSHGKLGAIINQRLACNLAGGTQSDPTISPVATSIMITTSNSLLEGSGMSNQVGGDLLHTMDVFGLSRVRTELCNLVVIPFLAPHPEQTDSEFARHGYLGDPGIPPHGQV